MRKRYFLVMIAVMVVGSLLAGCGAPDAKVIKIATQSPLSGGMSAVGTDIKNGAQLAME
jgi:branched-chain amino acid transport system substrate-binding protein